MPFNLEAVAPVQRQRRRQRAQRIQPDAPVAKHAGAGDERFDQRPAGTAALVAGLHEQALHFAGVEVVGVGQGAQRAAAGGLAIDRGQQQRTGWRGIVTRQPGQLIAQAFGGIAERAERIGQLNMSPELLNSLLGAGGATAGTRRPV